MKNQISYMYHIAFDAANNLIHTNYNLFGLAFASLSAIVGLIPSLDHWGSIFALFLSTSLGLVSLSKAVFNLRAEVKKQKRADQIRILKMQFLKAKLSDGTITLDELDQAQEEK